MGLKISVDGLMTVLQYEKNTRGLPTAHIHGESWIAAQKSDLKPDFKLVSTFQHW